MNHISKSILAFTLITIFSLLLMARIYETNYKRTVNSYLNALRTATNDATTYLRENRKKETFNYGYDGFEIDKKEIPVDFQGTIDRFYRSLFENLDIQKEKQAAFKMHIPIKGIAGYKEVYICTWDDVWLPPRPYSYFNKDDNAIYNYTLGEEIWYFNTITGDKGWKKLSDIPSPTSKMSHEEFKNYVIMKTINDYFTAVASSDLSLEANNQKKGIEFILPHADDYYSYGNIIDNVGAFALIDGVTIGLNNQPLRLASFGGAQLKLQQ